MALIEGADGKLHYSNEKLKYSDYWDWFDNGPGSEKWKRDLRESMKKHLVRPPFHPFTKEAAWKKQQKIDKRIKKAHKNSEQKEYITDEDLEIDV
jgi:hypothetical protein